VYRPSSITNDITIRSYEATKMTQQSIAVLTDQRSLNSSLSHTLNLAVNYALQCQKTDGNWCGELRSNPTMTAEYVFLRQALRLDLTGDREALCLWFTSEQRPDKSWSNAPDYPGDVSTTTEAYLALKILGLSADNPILSRARHFVVAVGGAAKVRIFTRIYLATFGLFPWDAVPQLTAELIFMPAQAPRNIYKLACWHAALSYPCLL